MKKISVNTVETRKLLRKSERLSQKEQLTRESRQSYLTVAVMFIQAA